MKAIAKPRMKKTRKLKKSPDKPFVSHGWKPPIRWVIKAWRRPGRSIRKVAKQTGYAGLKEAREIQAGMIKDGWESAEVSMEEVLHQRADRPLKLIHKADTMVQDDIWTIND